MQKDFKYSSLSFVTLIKFELVLSIWVSYYWTMDNLGLNRQNFARMVLCCCMFKSKSRQMVVFWKQVWAELEKSL